MWTSRLIVMTAVLIGRQQGLVKGLPISKQANMPTETARVGVSNDLKSAAVVSVRHGPRERLSTFLICHGCPVAGPGHRQ